MFTTFYNDNLNKPSTQFMLKICVIVLTMHTADSCTKTYPSFDKVLFFSRVSLTSGFQG